MGARAMPTIDASLLDLFRAELEIHLPALSEGLLALEKEPAQPKRLEALMRAAHSIKGAAKIVGVDAAVRVAHVMEDCFVAAQNGRIHLGSDSVDVFLRGVDALSRIVPGGEERDEISEQDLAQLVEDIAALQTGNRAPAPRADATPIPAGPLPAAPDLTIRPTGNFDKTRAEGIRAQLSNLLRQGVSSIQFDLAGVGDMDATGLALLAHAARTAARRQPPVELKVRNVSAQVQKLLRLTRLDESFPFAGEGA
jgi:anti-anti-sigma factor